MKSFICAGFAAVVLAKEDAPVQDEEKCRDAMTKANKACDKFG